LATQVYRFLAGRVDFDEADKHIVDALVQARPSDFRLDDLMVELVSKPSFLYRRVEK
jgi:hypothetical protein